MHISMTMRTSRRSGTDFEHRTPSHPQHGERDDANSSEMNPAALEPDAREVDGIERLLRQQVVARRDRTVAAQTRAA